MKTSISETTCEFDFESFIGVVGSVAPIYKSFNFLNHTYNTFDAKILKNNKTSPKSKSIVHPLDDLFIGVIWETGGIRGGGWSGEKPERYVTNELPGDIDVVLCKILLALGKEHFSFVRYNAQLKPLVKKNSVNDKNDHYGNQIDYSAFLVNLKALYEAIYA
jgi:hypothetical protein